MVIQKRREDMVELLRADFFARYEPNAAMVHASMHLQLPQLRGYWPFSSVNESGNVYDLSGQGRILTNNNTVPFAWYNLLPYGDFTPGSNHYFSRADEAGLDITGAITFGGWFWMDTLASGNDQCFMSKNTAAGDQRAYNLWMDDPTNTLYLRISSLGTAASSTIVGSTTIPVASTWYHIVGRFTPNTLMSIFVDGVATNLAAGVPGAIFNSSASLLIGSYNAGAALLDGRACQCFLCADDLDDVMIWNIFQQTRANFGK